jgi:hypothetical protein
VELDDKQYLLLKTAYEIKKTKLKLKLTSNADDKRSVAIYFPEKLRKTNGQFGTIQCNSDNVELRFIVERLKDTNFFKTINEIDINKEKYRDEDKSEIRKGKSKGKGKSIPFFFDKFDFNSKKFIEEDICKQIEKAFNLFYQKGYEELENNIEELECILELSIFKKDEKFKDKTIQEVIQILDQQGSDFSIDIQFKEENGDLDKVVENTEDDYIDIKSFLIVTPEEIEVTETEIEQVIKGRVGQSTFKRDLLAIQKKCRLCGVSDKRFLVASHIKPWSKSNNQERLDVNNGLLLCPNHDALFDKRYISFNDEGTILISDSLDEPTKVFLNINETMNIRMNESQQQYMKWHKENLFKY